MPEKLAKLRRFSEERLEQFDALYLEAQRLVNVGEEGAAAELFERLSESLGEVATILKRIHDEKRGEQSR